MILLELNEANIPLLTQAATELDLKNIKIVLSLPHASTIAEEQRERYGLDPWTQWVSIHTGKTLQNHNVRHLDQRLNDQHKQIWDILIENSLTCVVWGALNARAKEHNNMVSFLPDLWSSQAYSKPNSFNDFLTLPKHYARNYGQIPIYRYLKVLFSLLTFFIRQPLRLQIKLCILLPWITKHLITFRLNRNNLSGLFELISTEIFMDVLQTKKPKFSLLFLNLVAHTQHHFWLDHQHISKELKSTFIVLDKILGKVLKFQGDQALIVMNGLTQKFIAGENRYLYRQKNLQLLMNELGIHFKSCEQLMTNDGYLYFECQSDMNHAMKLLNITVVDKIRLFDTEVICLSKHKLFFQLTYWKQAPSDACITLLDRKLNFNKYFENLGIYTGGHTPNGDIFYQGVQIPQTTLKNHQVFDVILDHFVIR